MATTAEAVLTQLTSDLAQLKQVTDQQVTALGLRFAELKQTHGGEIDVVKTMAKGLNDKVDAIKVAADANDHYVKTTVDERMNNLALQISEMALNHAQVKSAIANHDQHLMQLTSKVDDLVKNVGSLQSQGINTSGNSGGGSRNIMEFKGISNLDKLSNDPKDFNVWCLRLKNNLKLVNPLYVSMLELIERLPGSIVTFEQWETQFGGHLKTHCGVDDYAFDKLKNDLYTVMVEKCSDNQVLMFENEEQDGFYAYLQAHRSVTRTAGLGGLERRDYLTNPQVAKKESEVYELIMAWERELRDQEKATPAEYRPLLSPPLKTSVMKKIAIGNVKEYIKTHEAVKSYEELRSEVLTMAMFSKIEGNKSTQAPAPMDINAVLGKINAALHEAKTFKPEVAQHTIVNGEWNLGGEQIKPVSEIDQAVQSLMALVKGKGKGKGQETRTCYNCGKTGHLSANCWLNKGKGKGEEKGWNPKGKGKGDYSKGYFGKGYGSAGFTPKGTPKGGCFKCGGPHYQQDCPKGGGKGINGVGEGESYEDEIKTQNVGVDLGGGNENWSDYFEYEGGAWAVDYEDGWQKVLKGGKAEAPKREVYAVNLQGEWEKITFTGDSGAVDHVITKDTAKAFKTVETAMSKAGIGFTAANGTRINNYGAKQLTGVTQQNKLFNMKVQVTDAQRNLASFPQMVQEGNEIFLSKKGCWIKNEKTGLKIPMRLKPGGTPEFDIYVRRADDTAVSFGRELCGQFSVLNENGEADIKDSEISPFQRLEKII